MIALLDTVFAFVQHKEHNETRLRSWKRRSSRTLARHDALEGAVTQVGGVEGAADFVGKVSF
jgi:hypothetical protein